MGNFKFKPWVKEDESAKFNKIGTSRQGKLASGVGTPGLK